MYDDLFDFFKLYQVKLGRAIWAATLIEKEAQDEPQILVWTQKVKESGAKGLELKRLWAGREKKRNLFSPSAIKADVKFDRALGGFYASLQADTHSFEAEDPRAIAAQRVMKVAFPEGAAAITHLSFVEQIAATREMLRGCDSEVAEEIELLGKRDFVERVRALNGELHDLIQPTEKDALTWDTVAQAERQCAGEYLQLVAVILGTVIPDSPERAQLRQRLLQPIIDQNEAIGRAFKRVRPNLDVNPANGEEELEEVLIG